MDKRLRVTLIALLGVLLMALAALTVPKMSLEARVARKMDLAVKSLTNNQFQEAIIAYNQAVEMNPEQVLAYQGLAKVYTLQSRFREARDTYDRGIKEVEEMEGRMLCLARAGMYLDEGDAYQAEQSFGQLLEADPSCTDAYQGLSLVYLQQGDEAKALAVLQEAAAKNPEDYRAYNMLADYLAEYGEKEQALKNIITSLELEVNQQEAYTVLAEIYAGNWADLAENDDLKASGKTSALLRFYAHYSNEEYAEAIAVFRDSLDNDLSNQKAKVLAAICMYYNDENDAAGDMIEEVMNNEPNEWIMTDIAHYFLLTGDKGEALKWAQRSFSLNYNNLQSVQIIAEIKKNVDRQLVDMYYNKLMLYNWQPLKTIKQYTTHRGIEVPALELPIPPETEAKTATGGTENANMGLAAAQLNQELCSALREKDVKAVKLLLNKGADPNTCEEITGFSALHVAALTNSSDDWDLAVELADLLINAGADINGDPDSEASPLRTAVFAGNTDLVKKLLDAGAEVNLEGEAVIASAVAGVNTSETLPILLAAGADPNAAYPDGTSGLMYAVQQVTSRQNMEVVNMLLKAGANPRAQNNDGETALMYAVKYGSTQYVKALLEAGADPNIKNHYGATALMYAAFSNKSEDKAVLLMEAGADPAVEAAVTDSKDCYHIEKGDTALSIAEANNNTAIIDLLCE